MQEGKPQWELNTCKHNGCVKGRQHERANSRWIGFRNPNTFPLLGRVFPSINFFLSSFSEYTFLFSLSLALVQLPLVSQKLFYPPLITSSFLVNSIFPYYFLLRFKLRHNIFFVWFLSIIFLFFRTIIFFMFPFLNMNFSCFMTCFINSYIRPLVWMPGA